MKFVTCLVNVFPFFSRCSSTKPFAAIRRRCQQGLTSQILNNQKSVNAQLTNLIQSLELIDLKLGMEEFQVGRLQLILKYYGYYLGNVDDYFGHKTQLAIFNLQQDLGLEAHGRFDGATWYALNFWLPF